MEFIGKKKDLTTVFNAAAKAVKSHTPIYTLECLKISAFKGKLKVEGTDNLISIISGTSDVEIKEEGAILVNSNILLGCLRKVKDDNVKFATSNGICVMSGKGAKFEIPISDAEEFPEIPTISKVKSEEFEIKPETLIELIDKTSYVCAIGETADKKPSTKSICIEICDGKLYTRTVDGYRLAESYLSTDNSVDFRFLVLNEHLRKIQKFIGKKNVRLSVGERHAMFVTDKVMVVVRLIGFDEVLSKESFGKLFSQPTNISVLVDAKDVTEAVDTVTPMIDTANKNPLVLQLSNETIKFSMKTSLGYSESEIPARISSKVEGDVDLKIGVNSLFLLEALASFDEEIKIEFGGAISPIKISGENSRALVLPMRLKSC